MKQWSELLARAGVVEGLRLQSVSDIRFHIHMAQRDYQLPTDPPHGTPQAAWDEWCRVVREEAKPSHQGRFEYELSGIQLLPEIHYLTTLSPPARRALSDLILASLGHWPAGWESAKLTKLAGNSWSCSFMSPLRYWLETLEWLADGATARPLSRRWLIPEFLLRGDQGRFEHLNPLSVDFTYRLQADPKLKEVLKGLGLNSYPVDEERTGPELLDALADAWRLERVPLQRFDVFLVQVRHAWRHFDPDKELPTAFLVRTGRRDFSTPRRDELADVYLPDNQDRTRALREHGKPILAMDVADANRIATSIKAVAAVKQASTLDERVLLDDESWAGTVDEISPLDETRYAWLPTVLLTIAAYGGVNPSGTITQAWHGAADRLRRARILECESIIVQLVDADQVVAASEPKAQWLSGDVLAIRRDTEQCYEDLAPAAQAMLGRQDLLKDLRLVLGALSGQEAPTPEQIEAAMERVEIDPQAFADVRQQWKGVTSILVDRIRPVLALLEIPAEGLNAAATDLERLKGWLRTHLDRWPASEVIESARQSRDDFSMGKAAWLALDGDAQLPAWNRALAKLGDRYVTVENHAAKEQVAGHLDQAKPFLCGLARHIARTENDSVLFYRIENASRDFSLPDEWSTRWWEVPFEAVIDALRAGYTAIPTAEHYLQVLDGVKTGADLRTAFEKRNIATEPDPYEIYRQNKAAFGEMLSGVHDLHQAWMADQGVEPTPKEPPQPPAELDAAAYLDPWSEAVLLKRSLDTIHDEEFVRICGGCKSLNEIREHLGLDPDVIKARQQKRLQHKREMDRQRRTHTVAGKPFEVGTESYGDLFHRLNDLANPQEPCARDDVFTPLANVRPSGREPGGGSGQGGKTSHLRLSAEEPELVGVVGEIHAYRFLRAQFGNNVVKPNTWASEIRLQVLPLAPNEHDATSDGRGYDFQFRYRGKRWHVEVKATKEDDPQFDLGISEIETASRLARQGQRWRILRVLNALSDQPKFEWLPNPFEDDFRKHFRLWKGSMRVSYVRK